jgi:RHS repeat-associated protein
LCGEYDTTYVYDTVVKLSRMLQKTTNGITTKYVYGHGLIGEEKECNVFKVYHFDYRGSTVAITDMYGNVTDRFEYDTYGKMVSHVGDSFVIFGYNGRDGVVTDENGLIYMRARYYNPTLCRFVNADIIHGEISHGVTLNRYAYANGNPVSFVDPFGLSAEERSGLVMIELENNDYNPEKKLSFWDKTKNFVKNTMNSISYGVKSKANKFFNALGNAIEIEVVLGTGLGLERQGTKLLGYKAIVLGLDDGKEYAGHAVSINAGPYERSYTHINEKDFCFVNCGEAHIIERKTISNIIACPSTEVDEGLALGYLKINRDGELSRSLFPNSVFLVFGAGYSVDINITEFLNDFLQ